MGLFINMQTASSELAKSPISDAITRFAIQLAVEKRERSYPNGPSLDVTFLLPGEFEAPSFSGMRMGNYTTENNTLLFEASVPRHILHSEKAPEYVAIVMQDVVIHANEFFSEHQIEFDVDQWHLIVNRLIQACDTGFTRH